MYGYEATHLATFPMDGGYRPCYPEFAYEGRSGEFLVFTCEYVVDVFVDHTKTAPDDVHTTFHGCK